jgi:hypothetical protein
MAFSVSKKAITDLMIETGLLLNRLNDAKIEVGLPPAVEDQQKKVVAALDYARETLNVR